VEFVGPPMNSTRGSLQSVLRGLDGVDFLASLEGAANSREKRCKWPIYRILETTCRHWVSQLPDTGSQVVVVPCASACKVGLVSDHTVSSTK